MKKSFWIGVVLLSCSTCKVSADPMDLWNNLPDFSTNSAWFATLEDFKWSVSPSESFAMLASNATSLTQQRLTIIAPPEKDTWESQPVNAKGERNVLSLLLEGTRALGCSPLFLAESTVMLVIPAEEVFFTVSMVVEAIDSKSKQKKNDVVFAMEDGFVDLAAAKMACIICSSCRINRLLTFPTTLC